MDKNDGNFIPQFALVDLDLDAVALCGAGSNSRADILLTKRREKNSMPKFDTVADLLKSLEPENVTLIEQHIAAEVAKKDTELVSRDATITDLNKQLEAAKAAVTPPAQASADLLKSVPQEVRDEIAKLRGTVTTLIDERNAEIANARFEMCKAIPVPEADLKEVLKTASPAAVTVLEKAAQAISEGLLKSKGKTLDGAFTGSADEAAYNKLSKTATEIMTAESISFEAAFLKACERLPDVYGEYQKGVQK